MARHFSVEIEGTDELIKQLSIFDRAKFAFLHEVGSKGKWLLRNNYLRGQVLHFKGWKDKKGRRKAAYRFINKRGDGVKITSYPLNLWERGFRRFGRRIAGKRVMSKLRGDIDGSRLHGWAEDFLRDYSKRV